ncbi:unnamed protein product, partial [marine sediment metagenome]
SQHWIVTTKGKLIGAARLSIHDRLEAIPDIDWFGDDAQNFGLPVVSFNRLVVDQEYRGRGIARQLDGIRLADAEKRGAKHVAVIAVKPSRVDALQALGFHILKELPKGHGLMVPETPHSTMLYTYPQNA